MFTKIRYRARLLQPSDVDLLSNEVEDICESNGWKCHRWEEDWSKPSSLKIYQEDGKFETEGHAPLRGVTFSASAESESIWLTFTSDGILRSLFTLANPEWTANDADYPWWRVKTKWNDANTHAAICDLFRYVSKKYCADFQVMEETGYWAHGDMIRLEKFMHQVGDDDTLLREEIAALDADETMEPERKREIMYELIRQFGERNRPLNPEGA